MVTGIGSLIKPTFINDEWLAQYEKKVCEVMDIYISTVDDIERGIVVACYFNDNDTFSEFHLITGIDRWEVLPL